MARHENNARTAVQQGPQGRQCVHLGIAVEAHRVVITLARFHAAGCVENEDVESPEFRLKCVSQAGNRVVVGQIGADDDGVTARLANSGSNLFGAGFLVAVVDGDTSACFSKKSDGVRTDSAG